MTTAPATAACVATKAAVGPHPREQDGGGDQRDHPRHHRGRRPGQPAEQQETRVGGTTVNETVGFQRIDASGAVASKASGSANLKPAA
jgi:hypothetical protein